MQAPARRPRRQADRHADRRDVPGRSGRHRHACWSRWAWPPARSCRRANGASSTPRSTAPSSPRSIPSTRPPSASSKRRAARSSARRRSATTARPPGWKPSATPAASPQATIDAAQNRVLPAIKGALAAKPIKGRITLSGYEGSELLVARLLIESGADVPLRRHRLPAHPLVRCRPRVAGSRRASRVQYRASLEQDLAAMHEFSPTSPSAPRRSCRRPRRWRSRRSTSPT